MWPTTMGLSDKEFQMCSDPRIRALLITRDGGGGAYATILRHRHVHNGE